MAGRTRPAQFFLCISLAVSFFAFLVPVLFTELFPSSIAGYVVVTLPLGLIATALGYWARSINAMWFGLVAGLSPVFFGWLYFILGVSQ